MAANSCAVLRVTLGALAATALGEAMRRIPPEPRAGRTGRGSSGAGATALLKAGMLWVWSPVKDVTLPLGGPRTDRPGGAMI